MAKLCLFDMDGTLSDDRQRQHFYLEGKYLDYFSYEAQIADPVYEAARALYNEMKLDGWEMGVLTARLERNRAATEFWISREGFEFNPVFLRPEVASSIRPPRFKSDVVGSLLAGDWDDVVLIDNDPFVIERVSDDWGAEHAFFADWDQNPATRSIQDILVPGL